MEAPPAEKASARKNHVFVTDGQILSCADQIRKKAGHERYIRVGPSVSLKLKPSQNM